MLRTALILALATVSIAGIGCGAEPDPKELITVTNVYGETVQIEASKICWNTVTPIPEGYTAEPDPETKSFRYVRTHNGPSGQSDEQVIEDGDVTCTCDSGGGGCSPFKSGSTTGCVMTSCSTCTKS